MTKPPSSSSSSFCLVSYTKIQFFARIRRFLQSKTTQKNKTRAFAKVVVNKEMQEVNMDHGEEGEDDDDSVVVLQRSVKKLHFGSWEEKEMAAMEIEKLAKEDVKTKKLMAELGVIPALVGMVSSEVDGQRRVAVKALIELANGTYT